MNNIRLISTFLFLPLLGLIIYPSTTNATNNPSCSGEVRFVAIGDTGYGNAQGKKTAKAISEVCESRGCDFILHLGDIVYPKGVVSSADWQWRDKFEKPFADIINRPWYFVMGNHDYGGSHLDNPKPADAGPYLSYAKKHPGEFYFPASSYSFHKGPVDFFAIDSALLTSDEYRSSIIKTMKPKIETSEAPWRIAFAHHTIVSNGSHYKPEPGITAGYDELVCDRKVHMLISSHEHNRQWFKNNASCPDTHLIVSGASAETTPFKEKSKTFTPSHALFQDDDDNGFFYVRARCTTLYGAFYDDNAKIDFEYTISK